MADVLRLSQVVGLFGPGAMLDLPDRSVVVGGLDRWSWLPGTLRVIEEPRLSNLLEARLRGTDERRIVQGRPLQLREPPVQPDGAQPFGGRQANVPVAVFPTWFVCDTPSAPRIGGSTTAVITAGPQRHRRRLVRWMDLTPPARKQVVDEVSGRRVDVTPIRFVCGCPDGHLQDVDWRFVVHAMGGCQEPMYLEEVGTSADPRDTRIACDCGQSLSLEELFQPGRLGHCRGERPWLGTRDPNGCTQQLKLLTRSATNTYFSQVATVISLPQVVDELSRRVAAHLSTLRNASSPTEIGMARKFNPDIGASLSAWADEEIFACLQRLSAEADSTGPIAEDPREAEYELLASGSPLIGTDRADSRLHAQTLQRSTWDPNRDPLLAGICGLVAVHRLREVSCLYGFTRFEAAPTVGDGDLEDVGLAVTGAPLGEAPDWLPAIEQFGEGLFLQLDPDAIVAWLARPDTQARADQLSAGYAAWAARQGRGVPSYRGLPHTLLHGLSHALMAEIAVECGYPASSLKERIYALPPLASGGPLRCGLLVYTATAGTQGTLGGLVEIAHRFLDVLRAALVRLEVCSNDPVCADHDPAAVSDERALHGAACHGCLLVAETSCEARNLFLDRAVLVPTMGTTGGAFFV
jgi:hypothetical protein